MLNITNYSYQGVRASGNRKEEQKLKWRTVDINIFCENKYKKGTDAKYCLKQHFLRAMYQDFENQPEPELSSVFLYFFRSVNVPGGSSRGPAGVTSQ